MFWGVREHSCISSGGFWLIGLYASCVLLFVPAWTGMVLQGFWCLSGLAVLRERVLECVGGWLCMCVCVYECLSAHLRVYVSACVRAHVWLIKQ